MLLKAYKFRLYPTDTQARYLRQSMGSVRFVYNWGLALRIENYKKQKEDGVEKPKSLSSSEIYKRLSILKEQPQYSWLKEAPTVSIGWALRNMDTAFGNFFKSLKKGGNTGFPKFKNRSSRQALQFHQGYRVDQENNLLFAPKVGPIKIRLHREMPPLQEGVISYKTATLSKTPSGKFFISILVEDIQSKLPAALPLNKVVGIDQGIRNFLTLSDSKSWPHLPIDKSMDKRLKKENRNLSRKESGSVSFNRQKVRLAVAHEKIAQRREGYLNYVASQLLTHCQTKGYDTLVFRDYDIQGMLDVKKEKEKEKDKKISRKVKRIINRSITNVAWHKFFLIIKNMAAKEGMTVAQTKGLWTSQRCNHCGHVSENNVKGHTFTCEACQAEKDSDLNAALNTRDEYIEALSVAVEKKS